jgi:hypothetical protein
MKNVTLLLLITFLIAGKLYAQSQRKLAKNEQIQQLAFDDTTRALANIFLNHRYQLKEARKRAFIGGAISAGVFGIGGLMTNHSNSDDETIDLLSIGGVMIMIVAAGGILVAISYDFINEIRVHPYTLRKFRKLLSQYQEGKSLPRFYITRLRL